MADISRRKFLGCSAAILVGGAISSAGYDKIAQFSRSLSKKEYSDPLASVIESMKKEFSHIDQYADSQEWAKSIRDAFEKNDYSLNKENLGIVLTLINSSSGFREVPRSVDFLLTPSENFFYNLGIKNPKTAGPLETEVEYVQNREGTSYNNTIKLLSTVDKGIFFGVGYLKEIADIYSNVEDTKTRLGCIFADYNSGIYSSRNAGLQRSVNLISGSKLSLDGRLLLSQDTSSVKSETEKAILAMLSEKDMGLSDTCIRADLRYSDSKDFEDTRTYGEIKSISGGKIEPVPAETPVRGGLGLLKKVLTGVGDSKDYSEKRIKEYDLISSLIMKYM